MEVLLLKSSACLLALIAFYKVFLERTSNHQFKRFYLLSVVLVSIGIPLITFIEYIEPQFILNDFNATTYLTNDVTELQEVPINYLSIVLWSLYGLGVVLFSIRFGYNLTQTYLKIKKNPKLKTSNFIGVLLKDLVIPHTFFNYIFLNKNKFENKEIPSEVLLHEQTHAKQKHSLDVLFIEVLQIAFWFNPLIYILKKDIKLNHEFLADQAVINQGINTANYQELLLEFSSNSSINQLANAINYSLIKKRFTVMKTKTSKQSLWLRSLLLLPLLAILIFGFSTTKKVEKELASKVVITNDNHQTDIPILDLKQNPFSLTLNGKETSLESLNEDFFNLTNGEKSNLKVNSDDEHIDYKLLEKIGDALKPNLENIILDSVLYIKDNKTDIEQKNAERQETLPMFGNSVFKGEPIHADRTFIINAKVATTTHDDIKSFKVKFPKKPTLTIKGNKLNDEAIKFLYESKHGEIIQIFDIKIDKQKLSPILISLVNKRDEKKYGKVIKGEESNIPPPPPPIPANATAEQKVKYQKIHEEYNRKYEIKNGEVSKRLPPPPPPIPANATPEQKKRYEAARIEYSKKVEMREHLMARRASEMKKRELAEKEHERRMVDKESKMVKREAEMAEREAKMIARKQEREQVVQERRLLMEKRKAELPPPPPPPKSPLDHVIDMTKKGATFFYEGKKISSDEAIKLLKENNNINISSKNSNGKNPTVHLSTEPIKN
ncbi:M56 family metallopeptidase [Lacinutrix iliipiscaria]|uniref:M56 family metallopeptidase n=1 Tax=Lacinutrix iliipiscaria TaxID=1230532 RepID=A0ABW5WK88_9FLAO